jgi:hypothetical protein
MKYNIIIQIILFFLVANYSIGQCFTFHGGFKPNNLKGSHLSVKSDIFKRKSFIYSVNYSLVKYTDSYAIPNNKQPNFHIENKRDKTIFDFPELQRGFPIQINERDFRPSSLNHRFSLFIGYEFLKNKSFLLEFYLGPHFGISRTIQYYIAYDFAEVVVNEGDDIKILPYHDYQIYRFWDLGLGARIDIGYKLFKNVKIGMSGQIFNDMIGEAIDLVIGGGISYSFEE